MDQQQHRVLAAGNRLRTTQRGTGFLREIRRRHDGAEWEHFCGMENGGLPVHGWCMLAVRHGHRPSLSAVGACDESTPDAPKER
jgi:hypothetical protein